MGRYKVHVIRTCSYSARALLTANALNLDFDLVVHSTYDTLKTPEFLALNPKGLCPVLETPEGRSLTESEAIVRYLARLYPEAKLYGDDEFDAAEIDILITNLCKININTLYQLHINKRRRPPDEELFQKKKKQFFEELRPLDDFLAERTFQWGNRLTIADICFAPILITAFSYFVTAEERAKYKNVVRYFTHIVSLDFWAKTFGKFRWCGDELPRMTQEQFEACLAAEDAKKKKALENAN